MALTGNQRTESYGLIYKLFDALVKDLLASMKCDCDQDEYTRAQAYLIFVLKELKGWNAVSVDVFGQQCQSMLDSYVDNAIALATKYLPKVSGEQKRMLARLMQLKDLFALLVVCNEAKEASVVFFEKFQLFEKKDMSSCVDIALDENPLMRETVESLALLFGFKFAAYDPLTLIKGLCPAAKKFVGFIYNPSFKRGDAKSAIDCFELSLSGREAHAFIDKTAPIKHFFIDGDTVIDGDIFEQINKGTAEEFLATPELGGKILAGKDAWKTIMPKGFTRARSEQIEKAIARGQACSKAGYSRAGFYQEERRASSLKSPCENAGVTKKPARRFRSTSV